MDTVVARPADITVSSVGGRTTLHVVGVLDLASTPALWRGLDEDLSAVAGGSVVIDLSEVTTCDSAGVALLLYMQRWLADRKASLGISSIAVAGANYQVSALLSLVGDDDCPVTEKLPTRARPGAVVRAGSFALGVARHVRETVTYAGSITAGLVEAVFQPKRMRWSDTFEYMARNGADALGIVALINFLMGAIVGFQTYQQLHKFGADTYLAEAVGVAITMELGALMTAIVLSGRSGAAFAAEIGTMTVNEEVDALDTMGLDRTRFLVMPKMLALLLAMPLLVIFADVCGIFGGLVIGVGFKDMPLEAYLVRTAESVTVWDVLQGLIKGQAYAVVIAAVGCLRGIQTRSGAQGVGLATTSAVVSGIFLIIVVDAVLTVLFSYV